MSGKNKTQQAKASAEARLIEIDSSLQLVQTVTYNIKQHVIVITEDKIRLCLNQHVKALEQRNAWAVPFSIAFTSLIALLTTTFQDRLYVHAEMWKSLFILVSIGAVIWMAKCIKTGWNCKNVHDVIVELKAQDLGTRVDVTVASETTSESRTLPSEK